MISLKGSPASATTIEIRHGLTETVIGKTAVDFQPDGVFLQDVLAQITQSVIRTAKLGCKFTDIYPVVAKYVEQRCRSLLRLAVSLTVRPGASRACGAVPSGHR